MACSMRSRWLNAVSMTTGAIRSSTIDAAAAALAALALVAVVLTFAGAVPAHNRLGTAADGGGPALATLTRVHLVRSLVWSAATVLAAALLVR